MVCPWFDAFPGIEPRLTFTSSFLIRRMNSLKFPVDVTILRVGIGLRDGRDFFRRISFLVAPLPHDLSFPRSYVINRKPNATDLLPVLLSNCNRQIWQCHLRPVMDFR